MKKRLTPKQSKALPLLASGMTGVETAKIVGVKPSTVSEWLHHCPPFSAELDRLRDQITNDSVGQLQASVALAADQVRHIITRGKSEALRLRAAEYVLDHFALPMTAPNTAPPKVDTNGGRLNLALVLEGLGITHVP